MRFPKPFVAPKWEKRSGDAPAVIGLLCRMAESTKLLREKQISLDSEVFGG